MMMLYAAIAAEGRWLHHKIIKMLMNVMHADLDWWDIMFLCFKYWDICGECYVPSPDSDSLLAPTPDTADMK